MTIHLTEDLIVEVAPMHKYRIITLLPFSKCTSPIFAQRKPEGKLRLLVDLWKISGLLTDGYTNNNHPVSTLSDAAQHLAGKSLFGKLDCCEVYHCLLMVDQRSVEILVFNFASRIFAHKNVHTVSADLCLHFEVPCKSTLTWLLKLTNVLNTSMILGLQSLMKRVISGLWKHS